MRVTSFLLSMVLCLLLASPSHACPLSFGGASCQAQALNLPTPTPCDTPLGAGYGAFSTRRSFTSYGQGLEFGGYNTGFGLNQGLYGTGLGLGRGLYGAGLGRFGVVRGILRHGLGRGLLGRGHRRVAGRRR